MNLLIQQVAPNLSTKAVSTADNAAPDHVDDQDQKTEFSAFLAENYPLSNILKKLRERLSEDEYLAVESWLSGGELLPLTEELAGEIVPFLAGNIDLFSPQIREQIQQLALRLHTEGQLFDSAKSMQELKGLLQQLASQPGSSNAATAEDESLESAVAQPNEPKFNLSPIPAVVGSSLIGEEVGGVLNVLPSMGSSGIAIVRSLSGMPVGFATANQPSAGLLSVPLGEPGWNQALGRQIQWMIGSEIHSASLKITPPQLGPIEINLSLKNDQANIYFAVQQAQVREALEVAIPRLREMFGEINLDLVNVDVVKKEGGQHPFPPISSDQDEEGSQQADGSTETQATVEAADNTDSNGAVSIRESGLVDDYA